MWLQINSLSLSTKSRCGTNITTNQLVDSLSCPAYSMPNHISKSFRAKCTQFSSGLMLL